MDIIVSTKQQKLAKQYKLKPQELAFADLCAVGWEPEDAWNAAIREGLTWNKSARKEAIDKLFNSPYVQERIDSVKQVLRKQQIESVKNITNKERKEIVSEAMSKEAMIYDLQTALQNMTTGTKEWLDTKKLIVEVTRMKQDEVKDEERTVHYFLPVRYPTGCQDCLYSRCDTCKHKINAKE